MADEYGFRMVVKTEQWLLLSPAFLEFVSQQRDELGGLFLPQKAPNDWKTSHSLASLLLTTT